MSVDVVLVVVAGAVLAIGVISNLLKRLWLSAPLVAMAAGVLLGPDVTGAVDPGQLGPEHRVLEELARITLSVSLVSTGLQMTRGDLRENLRRVASLLTVAMVGMWLVTSLGAHLLLGVEPWIALLIGAILTPTDPVVASTLVEGPIAKRNLPRWLRRSLQLESGANDGLAVAFVLVPALVLAWPSDDAGAIAGEVAKQIGLAVGVGVALGWLAARIVTAVEEHEEASSGFFLVSSLAIGLLVLGLVHWLGGTGVLASFLAGVTFSVVLDERYADELEQVQSGIERLMIVPVFLLFGTLLPWDGWEALGWSGLAFALWTLLLRRPAGAVPALVPTATPRRGVAWLGWFGPLGVAAIYYVAFVERYGFTEYERVFAACTLAIAVSVVAHSVTATPGVRRFGGRSASGSLRQALPGGDGAKD